MPAGKSAKSAEITAKSENFDCEHAYVMESLVLKIERDRYFESRSSDDNIQFAEGMILLILLAKGLTRSVKVLDMLRIMFLARKTFMNQGQMLELDGPINICGDIHGHGTRILCMHGGISPRIETLEDLKTCRPVNGDPREDCLEMDLMWADPSDDHEGCQPCERGGNAFTFGPDVVKEVLDKLNIDMIVRAHQVVRNGYEFHAGQLCDSFFGSILHWPIRQFGGCLRCLGRTGNLICSTHSRDPNI